MSQNQQVVPFSDKITIRKSLSPRKKILVVLRKLILDAQQKLSRDSSGAYRGLEFLRRFPETLASILGAVFRILPFNANLLPILLRPHSLSPVKEDVCLEDASYSPASVANKKTADRPQNQQINFLSVKSSNLYVWRSLGHKDHAKKLIEAYQKHLSKQYFFRSKGEEHNAKVKFTAKALTLLENNSQDFLVYLNDFNKNKVLDVHRDVPIIQKIGMFYKGGGHETKGRYLIKELLVIVAEDRTLTI